MTALAVVVCVFENSGLYFSLYSAFGRNFVLLYHKLRVCLCGSVRFIVELFFYAEDSAISISTTNVRGIQIKLSLTFTCHFFSLL